MNLNDISSTITSTVLKEKVSGGNISTQSRNQASQAPPLFLRTTCFHFQRRVQMSSSYSWASLFCWFDPEVSLSSPTDEARPDWEDINLVAHTKDQPNPHLQYRVTGKMEDRERGLSLVLKVIKQYCTHSIWHVAQSTEQPGQILSVTLFCNNVQSYTWLMPAGKFYLLHKEVTGSGSAA